VRHRPGAPPTPVNIIDVPWTAAAMASVIARKQMLASVRLMQFIALPVDRNDGHGARSNYIERRIAF
jgi:hypothetical protein